MAIKRKNYDQIFWNMLTNLEELDSEKVFQAAPCYEVAPCYMSGCSSLLWRNSDVIPKIVNTSFYFINGNHCLISYSKFTQDFQYEILHYGKKWGQTCNLCPKILKFKRLHDCNHRYRLTYQRIDKYNDGCCRCVFPKVKAASWNLIPSTLCLI